MTTYHYICLAAFIICLISLLSHFIKVISSGAPIDHAQAKGTIGPGIRYSFTKGMSPTKKETAYLHLPTYTAGILYHIGTFLGFALLALLFFEVVLPTWMITPIIVLLVITGISGFGILIKRILSNKQRKLSNPDDYISNFLVSGFHFVLIAGFLWSGSLSYVLIYAAVLFLYMPLGKLKHTVYFFTSRMHLGIFFGRRGVWPVKKQQP